MRVIRRFHVVLPERPGLAALYSVTEDADGARRLRWDGLTALQRISQAFAPTLNRAPSMSLSLRFALLCDYASNGAGGKPIAVHIFERFNVSEDTLKHPLPRFSILARIECSIADGNSHALELALVDEDGTTIAKMDFPPAQFHSQGEGQPLVAGYTMQVEGLRVPRFGTYEFRFRVGGKDIGIATFNVVKLPAASAET